MVDRRVSSDNFVTFVTASDAMMGRLWAQWIVEKLNGKGNVLILGGQAGSSPNEDRVKPAMQVFSAYPGIKILDTVYSDWSPVKGKQVMQAAIAKYGHDINAVFATHGLQVPGSIEAFIDAGWAGNEIPPHTSADLNGPMKMALKYKFPLLDIDYPPAMMGVSLEVALKVLAGASIPMHLPDQFRHRAFQGRRDGIDPPSGHVPGGPRRPERSRRHARVRRHGPGL